MIDPSAHRSGTLSYLCTRKIEKEERKSHRCRDVEPGRPSDPRIIPSVYSQLISYPNKKWGFVGVHASRLRYSGPCGKPGREPPEGGVLTDSAQLLYLPKKDGTPWAEYHMHFPSSCGITRSICSQGVRSRDHLTRSKDPSTTMPFP